MQLSNSTKYVITIISAVFLLAATAVAQPCTTLGQTPTTAFPVCGTTTFTQNNVPLCNTNSIFVPGCSNQGSNANYENKNPFFYKFTCYTGGTLGFTITPLAANEDYDWQLYDITGVNPNDIFNNNSLVVTGNWAGTYGATGASATGTTGIQCASDPAGGAPTFTKMPTLIVGHEYLLMISHFTDTQSGYTLAFGGGTAVITDPKIPTLASAKPDCDGTKISVKLNKKIRCNSLTATGSEFSILPAVATVIAATTDSCSFAFDADDIILTLSAPLTNGTYQVIINNGLDGNTLLDNCGNDIPPGESVNFIYAIPQPIFADSIGKVGCAPDSVKIYFPKKIQCSSIASNGSDFSVAGPSPVVVASATGNCINGKTDFVVVKFATPIYHKGIYQLTLKAGDDGTVVIDECGQETPIQTLPFTCADTVNADFTFTSILGCQKNSLTFTHNGAHDVNKWNWNFNGSVNVNTQTHAIVFSATSTNTVSLFVTNGTCADSSNQTVVMNNEVKADFNMPDVICPEDPLLVVDSSSGLINNWQWNFGNISSSNLKVPGPQQFPPINIEKYYQISLQVTNTALNCTDKIIKNLRVLNNCFIAVPTGFTPNGDGLNDFLFPNNAIKAENLVFKVYNRWGQLVFSSNNWQQKWNGKVNGQEQSTGIYVWFLSYTHRDTGKQVFEKGTTVLIK